MAGNMKFSHAVGYRGLCSIKPHNASIGTVLLCTGGNINLTQDPIMSGGVWGAGYANAAPIAYAFNYLALEGSINFEWVNQSAVWMALKKFALTDRTYASEVHLLPDGANGFHGEGWCSSLSFEASEGAALTGSMNFKGDPSDETPGYGIVSNNDVWNLGLEQPEFWSQETDEDWKQNAGTKIDNYGSGIVIDPAQATSLGDKLMYGMGANGRDLAGATLIPYWNTKVSTLKAGKENATLSNLSSGDFDDVDDVINWSVNYNSDLQVLKCCSFGKHLNSQTHTPIGADYILCGEMSGDGNLTVFALRESGSCSFSPTGFHIPKKYLTFTLGGFDANSDNPTGVAKSVVVPNALISSGSTSMATGASYITTDYSFTAIGDGVNPVLYMADSDFASSSSSDDNSQGNGEGGNGGGGE